MKTIAMHAFVALILCHCLRPAVLASGKPEDDPCGDDTMSEVDMRECYTNEQMRVTAEADSLASRIAGNLRKAAREGPDSLGADALRKAVSGLTKSQQTWKVYRDQYCTAVKYTWTNGSGARTAYEDCMFQLGRSRLQELRSNLELWSAVKKSSSHK